MDEETIKYILREYQTKAVDIAVDYFLEEDSGNGIIVMPTGSGKSLIISAVAKELEAPVLVLQPSREILQQNYDKYLSYGLDASIYSASFNKREISKVTFAMIGSIIRKKELFESFKYVIIDECHGVNPKKGMYKDFIENSDAKILGLTATPYRLSTDGFGGSILKFITRTRPRVFSQLLYYVQIKELTEQGYLAPIKYETDDIFDSLKVKLNSTGADFNEQSLRKYCSEIQQNSRTIKAIKNNLHRKAIVAFVTSVDDATYISSMINNSAVITSKTEKKERNETLSKFKQGIIKVIINVGVLTLGFDYPELDTIIISRPTMSLALYYQMIGRGIRYSDEKEYCIVVDLTDNYKKFGDINDLILYENNGKPFIGPGDKQLTNTYFQDNKKFNIDIASKKIQPGTMEMPFGKYKGEIVSDIDLSYLKWLQENCSLQGSLKKEVLRVIVEYKVAIDNAPADIKKEVDIF